MLARNGPILRHNKSGSVHKIRAYFAFALNLIDNKTPKTINNIMTIQKNTPWKSNIFFLIGNKFLVTILEYIQQRQNRIINLNKSYMKKY